MRVERSTAHTAHTLFRSLLVAGVACACASPPATEVDAGRDASPGPGRDAAIPLVRREPWAPFPGTSADPPLFAEAPWLRDEANGWRTTFDVAGADPPRTRRGALGLGNGHVFGFVGIGEPDLFTIHEATGPGYDRGEAFFSDVTLAVTIAGGPWTPERETQWRVRGTAIVVTVAEGPGLTLATVDFAPYVRAAHADAPSAEELALVRIVAASATGAPASDVRVSMIAHETWSADADGAIRQRRDAGARSARLAALSAGASTDATSLAVTLSLGDLADGAEARGLFALAISRGASEEAATLAALAAADPLAVAAATRDRFRTDVANGASVEAPEPMLVDLVDSMRVTLLTQTAANGAACPMSQYTRAWLRDTIGPVLGLSALGHADRARRATDYLWVATVANGELENSMPGDLVVPDPLPADPGFAALPPLSGRVRAEGPSWLVLAHDEVARWTADRSDVEPRIELLLHALLDQAIDAEGLLPFSGDETYRTAMAFALDLAPTETFEGGYASMEAGALLAVAAERLAIHADALGRGTDADALRVIAARARAGLDATFERADGALLPFRAPDGSLAPSTFEDPSLTPAWLGYLDGEPARRARSVRAVWAEHGTDQGFPMTPLGSTALRILPPVARLGVYTGMSSGMFLGACARADLPEGDAALDALSLVASSTGEIGEYMTFSDHGSFSVGYDAEGTVGDRTARYRPWEGGIDVRALLDWLFGVEPALDASGATSLAFAPHLPPGWDGHALRGLRVGDARLDLEVSETRNASGGAVRALTVTRLEGTTPIGLSIGLRAAGSTVESVVLDGAPIDPASLTIDVADGRVRLDVAAPLDASGITTLVIGYR